ncbi:hypothetical protein WC9_01583 [Escherichia coli KTE231]|nr:hypothetical protein WC9_01583 [Escherichia coli KTE231]
MLVANAFNIPLGSFINWENLFADEFKNKE